MPQLLAVKGDKQYTRMLIGDVDLAVEFAAYLIGLGYEVDISDARSVIIQTPPEQLFACRLVGLFANR